MNTRNFLENLAVEALNGKNPESDITLDEIKIGDYIVFPCFSTTTMKNVRVEKIETKIFKGQDEKQDTVKHIILNDKITIGLDLTTGNTRTISKEFIYENPEGRFILPHYLGYFASRDISENMVLDLWAIGEPIDGVGKRFVIQIEDQKVCSTLNVESAIED